MLSEYKQKEWEKISSLQELYVNELIDALNDEKNKQYSCINFNSATGTGKTHMIIKLINLMPECFFVVTTLTKGSVKENTGIKLGENCPNKNFIVYGNCDYSANTTKQEYDFMNEIPFNTKRVIWIRDESHIKTENYYKIFEEKCDTIINFSATNNSGFGIDCDFSSTTMLRKVNQQCGTVYDAISKLMEVKEQHKNVPNYNPCAIFRDVSDSLVSQIVLTCKENNLKYIDLSAHPEMDILELCEDDNEYDVIINKFKLVEGTDLKRAHIFYLSNEPQNTNTTVQCIGRCRRNALLYRDDIDIYTPDNADLLENTLQCYIYYNVVGTYIEEDGCGNLVVNTTDKISCEDLNIGKVNVKNGRNEDGLLIQELDGETGTFDVYVDKTTGLKCVTPETDWYKTIRVNNTKKNNFVYRASDSQPIYIDENTNITFDNGNYHFVNSFNLTGTILENFITGILNIPERPKSHYIDLGRDKFNRFEVHEFKPLNKSYNIYSMTPIDTEIALGISYREVIKKMNKDTDVDTYVDYMNSEKDRITIYVSETNGMSVDEFIEYCSNNNYCLTINWQDVFCPKDELVIPTHNYKPFTHTINDRELGIIGTDGFTVSKNKEGDVKVVDVKTVTSRVSRNNSKLTRFIVGRYKEEYRKALSKLKHTVSVDATNPMFPTKCNSCRGYIVEYLIKTMLYGKSYLRQYYYLSKAQKRKQKYDAEMLEKVIVFDACMMMYKDEMKDTYGNSMKLMKTISANEFVRKNYTEFVNNCYELAEKSFNDIAEYIEPTEMSFNSEFISPNLSVKNISALCDIIDEHTIIDIKATGKITPQYIRQVLAYHYLSTKRTDLQINMLVVYEVITGQRVEIKI